jgi:GNAT superfamily N-acetyltransferase
MQFIISDCLQLNRFYKENKDKARAKPSDLMFVAQDEDEQVRAALRLLPYQGFLFLRSVLTQAEYRGQGLASELIEFVIQQQANSGVNLPIYTLPTPLAAPLYIRLGFKPIDRDEIPSELLASYRRFRQSDNGPTVMVIQP